MFGGDVCKNFSSNNKISLICRAHQLVMDGYKWMFHDQLVTVWSAPNYCYRCAGMDLVAGLLLVLVGAWLGLAVGMVMTLSWRTLREAYSKGVSVGVSVGKDGQSRVWICAG